MSTTPHDALKCAEQSLQIISNINSHLIKNGIFNPDQSAVLVPTTIAVEYDGVTDIQKVVNYFAKYGDQWFLQQTLMADRPEDRKFFGSAIVLDPEGRFTTIQADHGDGYRATYGFQLQQEWTQVHYTNTQLEAQAIARRLEEDRCYEDRLTDHQRMNLRLFALAILMIAILLFVFGYNNFYLASLWDYIPPH